MLNLRIAGILFTLALCTPAAAQPPAKPAAAEMSVRDIRACMDRNVVDRGALRDISIKVSDREGKSHALRLRLYWKPAGKTRPRMNLRVLEPVAIRGSSYLLLIGARHEEVFFYLPGADRALRITGQNMTQPLWGTDFSYGEIKQVVGLMLEGHTDRKADAKVDGRPVFVLETITVPAEIGYQKVVTHVDQATCVPLKTEFFAKPGKPRKVLETDTATLLSADRYWVALRYTMRDLLEGSKTELNFSDLSLMEQFPERLFEPTRFFEAYE